MVVMKQRSIINAILIIFFLAGSSATWAGEKINVFVSIAPQKYFVEAIAGDRAAVTVLVDPRHSPHDYEPTPAQMMGMSRAQLYFAVGVPFESTWLTKFSSVNPAMKVVFTDAGIEKKPIDRYEIIGSSTSHEHDGHDHHAEAMDPHIWLSPALVKIQAGHILEGLKTMDPSHAGFYEDNHRRFTGDIDRLDRELKDLFPAGTRGKKFLVFHPSWGYFADACGLTQISIEIAGKDPKARDVKQLIEFAKANQIRMIFIQPQFSVKQAEIIARETGATLIVADPLAENWHENLKTVASAIRQAVR